jgi:hypothetical protein
MVDMTQITTSTFSVSRLSLFYLLLGSSTSAITANLVVTGTAPNNLSAVSFYNVDQTTPYDGLISNSISTSVSNPPTFHTLNVASRTGDLVCDCLGMKANAVTGITPDNTQNLEIKNSNAFSTQSHLGISTKPGAGTVAMKWTFDGIAVGSGHDMHHGISIRSLTPLPVELLDFSGKNTDRGNLLSWVTASESNNRGFDIERSTEGSQFQKIGFMKGKGTTIQEQRYSFKDSLLLEPLRNKITYYRLKQLDFDGRFDYSKILAITNKNNEQKTRIYPNPSHGVFNILTSKREDKMLLFNEIGVLVRNFDTIPNELDIQDLPSGIYWMAIGEEKIKVIKI